MIDDYDERLKESFINGIFKGMGYTLIAFFLTIILILLMFGSPDSKTKMICEPCATMIWTNV